MPIRTSNGTPQGFCNLRSVKWSALLGTLPTRRGSEREGNEEPPAKDAREAIFYEISPRGSAVGSDTTGEDRGPMKELTFFD
jgi:hypothetical protein